MSTAIEEEIGAIEWRNDKGISSDDANLIAILTALNEICKALEKIATQGIGVRSAK